MKKILPYFAASAALILILMLSGLPMMSYAYINTGLTHCWAFNESSGNPADNVDSATLTNTNTATYSAGKFNNAITFASASSQYLTTTSALSGSTLTAYTFSWWVNFTNIPSAGMMFRLRTNYGAVRVDYRSASGINFLAYDNTDTGFPDIYNPSFSTGTWHMVTVTWDGSTAALYVDGAHQGSDISINSISTANNSGAFWGTDFDHSANFFNGQEDEFGYWERALSATEITGLYRGSSGLACNFLGPHGIIYINKQRIYINKQNLYVS